MFLGFLGQAEVAECIGAGPMSHELELCRIPALTESMVYIIIYTMLRTAKLFRNGRSQAVRLPADLRFQGSEVYIRFDPASGDVILSRRPESWKDFFELMNTVDVPEDFRADRKDVPPQKRDLF